jgi:hypothetical protein
VNNLYRNVAFADPTFDFHNFDFDQDVLFLDTTLSGLINSHSPDLSAFKARGGKLLMWQGWTDTTLEPRTAVSLRSLVLRLPPVLPEVRNITLTAVFSPPRDGRAPPARSALRSHPDAWSPATHSTSTLAATLAAQCELL